jgi:hypothetical protein
MHTAQFIREFIGKASIRDIIVCDLRERDINEPFVYCKLKDGRELRLACSVDDAAALLARVKGWIARPETFPASAPGMDAAVLWPVFWAAFALLSIVAAWHGTKSYWLVAGWAYTSHGLGGMALSAIVFTAFWLTVASNPIRLRDYLMSAPLLIAMTFIFTAAGKTVNAKVGAQEIVEVRGRIVAMDDASFTAYFTRGKGSGFSKTPIARWFITVKNERGGHAHRIEVPGRIATRDGLSNGMIWEDRFYRGSLGWLYRKGANKGWDEMDFVPRAANPPH